MGGIRRFMEKLQESKKISIIIPIFNAEQFLPDLFHALSHNTFLPGDEVLLVDNGSTDHSAALCKAEQEKRPDIYRCLSFTEEPGPYAARNYAIQQAEGEIFVFTDSDCKPVPHWLDAVRENIKEGTVIAGKVEIEVVNDGLWEHFDSIAHLNSEKSAANNKVATANMAVTKSGFMKVGFFEKQFSGEDYAWSKRAAATGLEIVYMPDVMVYHPSRKTFAEILRKDQRIAFGAGNHAQLHGQSGILLWCKYFLKIFKFDTNVRYTKQLKKVGMNGKALWEFNCKFMRIRVEQLKFAMKGYNQADVRKLGIK